MYHLERFARNCSQLEMFSKNVRSYECLLENVRSFKCSLLQMFARKCSQLEMFARKFIERQLHPHHLTVHITLIERFRYTPATFNHLWYSMQQVTLQSCNIHQEEGKKSHSFRNSVLRFNSTGTSLPNVQFPLIGLSVFITSSCYVYLLFPSPLSLS